MTAFKLDYAAISDVGRYRRDNQDSGYAGPWLLAIADGVGGAVRGDLASATTMSVLRSLDEPPPPSAADDPEELLTQIAGAIHRAHDRIAELVEDDPALTGTSTTVTLGRFDGTRLAVGHVGDSRAYLLRDGEITQITKDHTFVQSLVDEGKITAEEAITHPHKNVILQAVDGTREVSPDLFLLELQAGDRLLFCSDGAVDVMPLATFAEILATGSPAMAAVSLIRDALEAGSTDNVTTVVADVLPSDPESGEVEYADGEEPAGPFLVGAAAELPQRALDGNGTTRARVTPHLNTDPGDHEDDTVAQTAAAAVPLDPEEARYAPRPPRGYRWLRVLSALAILAGLAWAALAVGWHFTQQQFYVSDHNGAVTIFRGLNTQILGLELSQPYETTNLKLDMLAPYDAHEVTNGMAEGTLKTARAAVEVLAEDVPAAPTGTS